MVRTNTGRDFMALVISGASGATGAAAPANYIGITSDATAPATTDTTLASEVSSGTLVRHIATYSHTTGQATYTLQYTFTSDQTITINKFGVFNAAGPPPSGTMVYETVISATPLVSGDQIQITETVTL